VRTVNTAVGPTLPAALPAVAIAHYPELADSERAQAAGSSSSTAQAGIPGVTASPLAQRVPRFSRVRSFWAAIRTALTQTMEHVLEGCEAPAQGSGPVVHSPLRL
jgi:hypothetical protein